MIAHQPKLFHFNSTCEIAIANGSPYFNTSALLARFELDLASIMSAFASPNDYILSEEKPNEDFLRAMQQFGLPMVNYCTLSEIESLQNANQELTFNMQSWGVSPAEDFYLKNVRGIGKEWKADKLQVVERAYASECLEILLQNATVHPLIGCINQLKNTIVRSEEEAERYLDENLPVVFKSPFSSSGRGLMVLRKAGLNDANRKWINTILKQQGYIVASKWLDKLQDFSFQFEVNHLGLHFDGVTYFDTNSNGQYKEHRLNYHDFSSTCEDAVITHADLQSIGEQVHQLLTSSAMAKLHKGKFGVDAFIYKDQNTLRVHPLVEINPRYTMGAVALALQKYIHADAQGFYRMHTVGTESYAQFIEKKQNENPPIYEDNKLKKGVISLTPFYANSKFGAYIELL